MKKILIGNLNQEEILHYFLSRRVVLIGLN